MKCNDIFSYLKELYPLHLAMEWDNSGFLIGRYDRDVKNVLVVLDITNAVIDFAVQNNVDLIIAHHPIIFSSIKRISEDTLLGKYILKIIENNISVIAMHTNFDAARDGMGDVAANRLHLRNTSPLEVTFSDEMGELGVGKIGELEASMDFDKFIDLVKSAFELNTLAIYGRENIKGDIKRVAVSPGSGKGMYKYALKKADVLITGDITHHEGLDASNDGICIIDATHYGLEYIFIDCIAKKLERFKDINILKFKDTKPVEYI